MGNGFPTIRTAAKGRRPRLSLSRKPQSMNGFTGRSGIQIASLGRFQITANLGQAIERVCQSASGTGISSGLGSKSGLNSAEMFRKVYRRKVSPLSGQLNTSEIELKLLSVLADAQVTENGPENKLRVLESILLIAKEPLSARKLAMLAELADPTEARTLARKLNDDYDSNGYSFRIEEIAGGLQLLTRPQFARWIRRLELVPSEVLLTQGMLEALAIVAYRQPVQRAEIEAIRGVASDEVLRQLMQRDLVRIAGRLEDLGRPYLYGTTRTFLQLFGLQSLDSLPRAQKIREAEAEIASRLAVNTIAAEPTASTAGNESAS